MTKKLVFSGYYGFQNFGDDLFGLACSGGVREFCSGFEAVILSPPVPGLYCRFLVPEYLADTYRASDWRGKALRVYFMLYAALRYRRVVLAGGSVLSSGTSNRMRNFQFLLARLRLCRFSAIGVSVGPFDSPKVEMAARRFIDRLEYLSVRDTASVAECLRIKV
ncbi:MAG: polysaccharide pyruvyl transferase family protein, partial [Pseudomonadota bacterium]